MKTSLIRIFHHPLVVSSILLLLVNDHFLKVVSPSWLTGKLSDFAGLFFFPFLLAWLFRLILRSTIRAVYAGFLLTAAVFAFLKVLPSVNIALTSITRAVLGVTPQINPDPTDVIALIVLIPAWLIWQHSSATEEPVKNLPQKRDFLFLGLATFASLASTPCVWDNSLSPLRTQVFNDRVYIGYRQKENDIQVFSFRQNAYTKKDEWIEVRVPDPALLEMLQLPRLALPHVACDPLSKSHCYRIDGSSRIDESQDGGRNWRTSWLLPPGRDKVIQRIGQSQCSKIPRTNMIDLTILPDPSGSIVVAVTGNEGTLVRKGTGDWQRFPVGNVFNLTPYQPQSLFDTISLLRWEIIISETSALVGYTLLSAATLWLIRKSRNQKTPKPRWALHPLFFAGAWLMAIAGFYFAQDPLYGTPMIALISLPAASLMLLILLILAAFPRGEEARPGRLAFLAVASLALISPIIFMIWLYAVIPYYTTALILAVAIPLLIFITCFNRIYRYYRRPPHI